MATHSQRSQTNLHDHCAIRYIAMSEGVRDLVWLSELCKELHLELETPALLSDSQAALQLSQKP
ncbi:TPA: hypothetical protein N0F65_002664 [Lagenidium giganteum]|uniref:Uncharacterized protein n=1 Tax=Lagenidium giganteum TaxID=4803 RepID=A0AAV2Z674_9STRA|nr:TPA: hypothetical protein N0F65_002664 [Lagenidium giganteum]